MEAARQVDGPAPSRHPGRRDDEPAIEGERRGVVCGDGKPVAARFGNQDVTLPLDGERLMFERSSPALDELGRDVRVYGLEQKPVIARIVPRPVVGVKAPARE